MWQSDCRLNCNSKLAHCSPIYPEASRSPRFAGKNVTVVLMLQIKCQLTSECPQAVKVQACLQGTLSKYLAVLLS